MGRVSLPLKIFFSYFGLSVIPLVIAWAIFFKAFSDYQIDNKIQLLKTIAESKVQMVDDAYASMVESMTLVASRTQMRRSFYLFNETRDPTHLTLVKKILRDAKISVKSIRHIHLLDMKGRVQYSTNESIVGFDHSKESYFLNGKKISAVNHFFEDSNFEILGKISGPMFFEDLPIGVIAIDYDIRTLKGVILGINRLGATGESVLFHKRPSGKEFIVFPLRYSKKTYIKEYIPLDEKDAFNLYSQSEVLIRKDQIDYRGKSVLVVSDPSKFSTIRVLVKMDTNEIIAGAYQVSTTVLVVGVLTIIIIMLLSRRLSNPILLLISYAEKVIRNEPIKESVEHHSKSLGQLGLTLQDIIHSVQDKNTELQQMNSALKKAKELNDEYLSMVSHDLQNPIGVIKGSLDLVLNEPELTEDERRELVKRAMDNSDYMQSLVIDTLNLARKEGSISLKKRTFRLEALVESSISSIGNTKASYKTTIRNSVDPHVYIKADYERLKQVLTNLLNNAIKFLERDKGYIEIFSEVKGLDLLLSVKDTGRGIDQRHLSKIFDKYIQSASTDKERGTGLGLSVCKLLCNLHGGDIWANSDGEHGATFTISLPNCVQPLTGKKSA